MKPTSKIISITFLLIWLALPLFSQKSIVKFYNTELRAGLDNVFYVVTQEEKPVQLNQIKVFFYEMWDKEELEKLAGGNPLSKLGFKKELMKFLSLCKAKARKVK